MTNVNVTFGNMCTSYIVFYTYDSVDSKQQYEEEKNSFISNRTWLKLVLYLENTTSLTPHTQITSIHWYTHSFIYYQKCSFQILSVLWLINSTERKASCRVWHYVCHIIYVIIVSLWCLQFRFRITVDIYCVEYPFCYTLTTYNIMCWYKYVGCMCIDDYVLFM